MRAIAAVLCAAMCLSAHAARAQDAYAAVLLQYLSGDGDAALVKLGLLDAAEVRAGLEAFDATRSPLVLTGAAAMHTEMAVQRSGGFASAFHLQAATAIVEFGERHTAKSNTPLLIHPQYARPVSDEFRRLWYCAVINGLEGGALLGQADRYLAHATALFPDNPEITLLAGVADEMHGSPRTANVSPGDRRKSLAAAERRYRAVLAAEPTRLEAQLRLAHVLQQLDQLTEARTLLQPLTTAEDGRIAYLAMLFLGGVEDRFQQADAAYAWYSRAAIQMPLAQAARLAASELLHRRGDRQGAAEVVPAAAGTGNVFDPWWTYVFGEYWRADVLLNALRKMRQG